jgi:hypothetical protein
MPKYTWRNGRFEDRDGEAMPIPERDGICVPHVIADIEPYQSPVDGSYVSGRAARRDDLKKHNCVPYDEVAKPLGGEFKNERFAKKWKLPTAKKETNA